MTFYPMMGPPYTQVLLLHMDGTNGSTSFPDATGRHNVIVALGTVAIDTSKSVFGGASAKFSNNSQLAVQLNRQDFDFETGDFTIDGWFFQTTLGGSDLWQWDDTNNNDPFAVVQTNGQLQWVTNAGTVLTSSAGAVVAGVQTHIAFTRASGILRGFVNGTSIGSAPDTNNYNLPLIDLIIGPFFDAVGSWLDEFRIIKGLAAWTSNFTPPTGPYLPGGLVTGIFVSGMSGGTFGLPPLNAGDVVGPVTVTVSGGGSYTGQVILGGADASKFALTNGGFLPCNLVVGAANIAGGNYNITLTAN